MHANHTQSPPLTEHRMASLLGISEEELSRLNHSGLCKLKDSYGVVYKYYIQFSTNNDSELLQRLDLGRSQTVYFTPDQLLEY
jgi:hypothetical protein